MQSPTQKLCSMVHNSYCHDKYQIIYQPIKLIYIHTYHLSSLEQQMQVPAFHAECTNLPLQFSICFNLMLMKQEISYTCSLVITRGTLILFDVLSPCRSYFHTFSMEPFLTHITTNPEFIGSIAVSTDATLSIIMLIVIVIVAVIVIVVIIVIIIKSLFLGRRSWLDRLWLRFTSSLHFSSQRLHFATSAVDYSFLLGRFPSSHNVKYGGQFIDHIK
eukprot:c26298_g1_i1 orf=971-1621(-)